jgi:phage virion morphogenesis protein
MPAVETVDLSGLSAALGRAGQAPADYRPLLKQFAVLLGSQAKQCFDGQRSPDGAAWAPLKRQRSRKRDKRAKKSGRGTGQKVLRDTGLLMASVTGQGSGHVETLTATSLVYGTNLVSPRGFPYPAAHQHGTRNMVARPFLGISAKAADVMAQMCADFVRRRMVEG